ncbi:HWE histidine kinase domain-containing protein [Geminicoccaceae bacterium 1502E]|nr:HWE histidine kinase domain-containing protein [Geminicoccaceae bacterium 1502E]
MAAAIAWDNHDRTLAEARARAQQTASILEEHALRMFEAQLGAIATVEARIAAMDWQQIETSEEVHRLLRSVAQDTPHIDGLWLVGPDGHGANSADFFPLPRVDASGRGYFQALSRRDEIHFGEMIRGRLKGNLNFNLSRRRASADDAFDGLVMVTISLDYLANFWREVLGEGPHSVRLLRRDGEVAAVYPVVDEPPPPLARNAPFFAAMAGREAGTYSGRAEADGRERLYAFTTLGAFPAYMVVGLDKETILAPWRRDAGVLALLAAVASIALATLVQLASRRERLLAREAERRRRAEHSLIAKEEHVAALERVETALRRSEERFRSLFETLTYGVVFQDAQGSIRSANDSAAQILGLSVQEMTRRDTADPSWDVVDGQGRPLAPHQYPAVVALRTGRTVRGFSLGAYNPKAGERRWLMVDAVPQWLDGHERPSGVFAIFSDVTEHRRAEESQRLLLREIDHRAKNALALVQAVIRLTRADTASGFAEAVEGRVAALARAHTLLARHRWEGADLRTLLGEELAPYEANRVQIEGPRSTLCADAAQPLGMVVHELATNAAKYGALSTPGGRLEVSWELAAGEAGLVLRWTEADGPPVAQPARQGFGSTLIEQTVCSQLHGSIERDWRPDGLRVLVRLPAGCLTSGRRSGAASPQARPGVAPDLKGARLLVAEDQAALALELRAALLAAGCEVVGPASSLEEAALLAVTSTLDGAVLDVDLGGRMIYPVAEILAGRGVPVLFCTGFGEIDRPPGLEEAPLLRKPVATAELLATLAHEIARAAPVSSVGTRSGP